MAFKITNSGFQLIDFSGELAKRISFFKSIFLFALLLNFNWVDAQVSETEIKRVSGELSMLTVPQMYVTDGAWIRKHKKAPDSVLYYRYDEVERAAIRKTNPERKGAFLDPVELAAFKNLLFLDLKATVINARIEFGHFPKLKEINIHGSISEDQLNQLFVGSPNLRVLSFNWQMGPIPASISRLRQLEFLELTGQQIKYIPDDSLSKLTALKYLKISRIDSLAMEKIYHLPNLEVLDIEEGDIGNVSAGIGKLQKLKQLTIGKVQAISFPNEFGELANLEHLYIGQLSKDLTFPKQLSKLNKLKLFVLSELILNSFPEFPVDNKLEVLVCWNMKQFKSYNLNLRPLIHLKKLEINQYEFMGSYYETLPLELKQMKDMVDLRIPLSSKAQVGSFFKDFNQLKYLDLGQGGLSFEDVKQIYALKKMEAYSALFLIDMNLSPAQQQELKKIKGKMLDNAHLNPGMEYLYFFDHYPALIKDRIVLKNTW